MTRISPSDQVLAAVRAQLQRLAKRGNNEHLRRAGKSAEKPLNMRQMVKALSAIEGLSHDEFVRTFVRALLTQEFGEAVVHSSQFQAVIERTAMSLCADKKLSSMLQELRAEDTK